MLVAVLQLLLLFGRTVNGVIVNTGTVDNRLHGHENVVELALRQIYTGRPGERVPTHGGGNHLDREVGRALERRTSAQVDDMLASLNHMMTNRLPILGRQLIGTNQVGQRRTLHLGRRSKYGHLLAVTAIGTAIFNLIGHRVEILGQLALQTGTVESCKGRYLRRFQARVEQHDETGNVGRVEDNHHVFHIGTIGPQIFTKLGSDLGIAFEQILTSHTGLAGGTARRYDISRTSESLFHIARVGEVHPLESTVAQLLGHPFESRSIRIVQADIGCQMHHQGRLSHV